LPPAGMQSIVISMSVCLFTYLKISPVRRLAVDFRYGILGPSDVVRTKVQRSRDGKQGRISKI